jgi:hypothetical protein
MAAVMSRASRKRLLVEERRAGSLARSTDERPAFVLRQHEFWVG